MTPKSPKLSSRFAALLLVATMARAAEPAVRLDPMPGSKMRIEGTSSVHDWQVEGNLIGGRVEIGPGFPLEPGQSVSPGKLDAKVSAFVPVRSLKSIEKDGRPYSDSMDDIMWGKLLYLTNPRIVFHLDELTLKEPAKGPTDAYACEARGELVVAGVTNSITMPVSITLLGDKKLKITGTTTVKMTDFKIEPPAPKVALGLIKTGDEVKLIFDWRVGPKPLPQK